MPFNGMVAEIVETVCQDLFGRRLKQTGKGLVLGEFAKLIVSHQSWRLQMIPIPRRPSGAAWGRTVTRHSPAGDGRTPLR